MKRRRLPDESLEHLINEIHEKLDGAAFNGGFESLVQTVQHIEKTQREMLAKMEDTHTAIYEPDDGLFARVKRVEAIHDKELEPLRRELNDLKEWREGLEAKDGLVSAAAAAHREVIELSQWKSELTAKDGLLAQSAKDHEVVVELSGWKKKIFAFILAAAGSTLLMIVKTAWEFIRDHVTLH